MNVNNRSDKNYLKTVLLSVSWLQQHVHKKCGCVSDGSNVDSVMKVGSASTSGMIHYDLQALLLETDLFP